MPPAKKPASKRAAAPTSRTTPSTRATNKVLSFDERRAKVIAERKSRGVHIWPAYGRDWHIKAPNAMVEMDFENIQETQDTRVIVEYLGSHFYDEDQDDFPAERDDFLSALYSDDEFGWDVLRELLTSLTETLAQGLNLPSSPSDG